MDAQEHHDPSETRAHACSVCHPSDIEAAGLSRREFVGAIGSVAIAGAAMGASHAAASASSEVYAPPPGKPLRVKPALVYQIPQRREMTSWRAYGGLMTREDVDKEAKRIEAELRTMAAKAEFGVEFLPVSLVNSDAEAASVAAADCDAILVYAASGSQKWLEAMAASKKPNVMFLRHRSGPFYLWYEIAHWRFLRKNEDAMKEPNMDVEDIVVDDYGDVLWRLRALYGLKNTLGTTVLALGGLEAYSAPGTKLGPDYAKNVWKFDVKIVPHDVLVPRIEKARADAALTKLAQQQAEQLLAEKNVTLQTDKRFVVNTFVALWVVKELMREHGATNLGVARCMGGLIRMLDTPPCLLTSLLNDEGFTAFCHADFTHTPPGVLLHHISGKPSFVANSHFPHHGMLTLAHCAAPRKMNGKDCEPTKIMTHFESDYGAATKVEYTKGQIITTLIPNLHCTRWWGLRGKVLDSPSYDACRSQIDLAIEGDWRRLLREMEGFHTIVCYGDYLREVGYALKKVDIQWTNVSDVT